MEWNRFSKKKPLILFFIYFKERFLHFVFLHFLTLQTMAIFPYLTLFLFSLSLSLSHTQQDRPPAKIFVAGHWGLVGSAIMWKLRHLGFANLVLCTHAEFNLTH
jgi:hypothetical protein